MSKKHRGHAKGDPVTYQTPLPAGGVQMETFLPWTLVRRGLRKQIITPLDAPQEFMEEARRERQARDRLRCCVAALQRNSGACASVHRVTPVPRETRRR